MINRT